MRKLLLISGCVLAYCAICPGQPPVDPTCPTVIINRSAQYHRDGIQLSADVDLKGWSKPIEYRWSGWWGDPTTGKVVSAVIAEGQGTPHIKILRTESNVTVKIEIAGFPSHCPNDATETTSWEPVPKPVKLAQFTGSSLDAQNAELSKVAQTVKESPNARFYVIIGYQKDVSQSAIEINQRKASDTLIAAGIEESRVTFHTLRSGTRIVQLWLVPAGARDPICEECKKVEPPGKIGSCPTISVVGPAGVTIPGDPMRFTASVSGEVPAHSIGRWKVEGGEIVSGQGTLVLAARGPKNVREYNITATFELSGLPDGCPNSASETAGATCKCAVVTLDEYGKISWLAERRRLDAVVRKASTDLESRVFVLKYFDVERKQNQKDALRIRQYLEKKGVLRERLEILVVENMGAEKTRIYSVPPGATDPSIDQP